ncbi:hypothetical protein [Phyllobacterium chamaecytisi]|uniref:hypothetical protein n=1 Tax=Phyllobacterium chamaecytisi TaxID=2876082 RepID=UPI001CCB2D7E|nr:hypothetical protein [Phyllobacterium sp. KW56]MBZ9600764.1 hypothetical protein [Phyllobacterium sp. KW56]
MVNRILIGNHPTHGLGGFVSVPGVDVLSANKFQMMWSSQQEQLQIVSSGSFLVTAGGPGTDDGGAFVPISWTPLGFTPMILLGCDQFELYLNYTSANSAQVRSCSYNESRFPVNYPTGNTTGYYMVTRTPKPF